MITLTPAQNRTVIGLRGILKNNKGALLRGETGCGKTFIAAEIMKDFSNVLFVCKASAKRDIAAKLNKIKGLQALKLVSYQLFGDCAKFAITDYDLIVFDECHMMANWQASYTQRMVRLKDSKRKYLFMSGTPEIKSPKDLLYVVRKCGVFADMTMDELKIKYFNAAPTHFSKGFLVCGKFQNEDEWYDSINTVTMHLSKEDVQRDMPPVKVKIVELDTDITDFGDITECTEARLKTSQAKIDEIVKYIRKDWRDNGINTGVILCHFHKIANDIASCLGVQVATTKEGVVSHFNRLRERGGYLVTTLGLTQSSLDLNECDHVYFAEYNYSAALDKQSLDRFHRVGKQTTLNATYFVAKGEHTFFKNRERVELLEGRKYDKNTRIYPSSLAILADCAGSHWLPDTRNIPEYIDNAAIVGTKAHSIFERYMGNNKSVSKSVSAEVRFAIELCRSLKDGTKVWGCETRCAWEYEGLTVSGKVDFWAYNKEEDTLFIYDYKNGKTSVGAKDNWQLKAYALMLTSTFNLEPSLIRVGILQGGTEKSVEFSGQIDIIQIQEEIIEILERVLAAKGEPLKHLGENCKSIFCPAYKIHKEG